MAEKIAKERGLYYVYLGNVWGRPDITYCPECGRELIKRIGFDIIENKVKDGHCPCGKKIYMKG